MHDLISTCVLKCALHKSPGAAAAAAAVGELSAAGSANVSLCISLKISSVSSEIVAAKPRSTLVGGGGCSAAAVLATVSAAGRLSSRGSGVAMVEGEDGRHAGAAGGEPGRAELFRSRA